MHIRDAYVPYYDPLQVICLECTVSARMLASIAAQQLALNITLCPISHVFCTGRGTELRRAASRPRPAELPTQQRPTTSVRTETEATTAPHTLSRPHWLLVTSRRHRLEAIYPCWIRPKIAIFLRSKARPGFEPESTGNRALWRGSELESREISRVIFSGADGSSRLSDG